MRKIKIIILFFFCCFHKNKFFAQVVQKDTLTKPLTKQSKKIAIDFFLLPTGPIFNTINLGIGYKKNKKVEYALLLGSRFFPLLSTFNLNANLNCNFYFNGENNYLPIWIRVNNTRTEYSCSECEENAPHSLRISIGSGYGRITMLTKKYAIRTEIGAGISFNSISITGNTFPYYFNSRDYYLDNKEYPSIFPTLKLKITFARLFNFTSK